MSKTIEALTTQIEELEKRIRSISASQTTLSQIIAMRDCIDQIKTYLEVLNDTVDNMESSASDAELDALKARVSICEEDISALQTDLATTQDDISTLQSSLNDTNTTVGQHSTTITNLQTTQTNLQATQSSQASTISSIDNRLTTCENNVNALTGGVDISQYETRLKNLEPVNNLFQSYVHKHYDFRDAMPDDFIFYTREYFYTCKPNVSIFQEFKLSYEFTGTGTMTVEMYENNKATGEAYTIDLEKNPNTYTIIREFCPTARANNIMLKCTATSTITYKSLDITMHGQELFVFEGNQDLKVACFNNNIYITRYYDDHIKYGKFASTDTIDIDNLPNSRPYNDAHGYHNYIMFAPFPRCEYPYTAYNTLNDDYLFKVTHKNSLVGCPASQSLETLTIWRTNTSHSYSNDFLPALYAYSYMPTITNSIVLYRTLDINGSQYEQNYVTIDGVTEWLYCNAIAYNHQTEADEPFLPRNMATLALADDGYFYLLKNRQTYDPYYCKICKGGIYATGYIQQDETINAYISFGNYVEQYAITKDEKSRYKVCTFVKKIEDCSCVYELFNDAKIKKTKAGWVYEDALSGAITE